MKRDINNNETEYYGLFNDGIKIETYDIDPWWNNIKYDIINDYNKNIKKIIQKISNRTNVKYSSLLISEEKKRAEQFLLANKILAMKLVPLPIPIVLSFCSIIVIIIVTLEFANFC